MKILFLPCTYSYTNPWRTNLTCCSCSVEYRHLFSLFSLTHRFHSHLQYNCKVSEKLPEAFLMRLVQILTAVLNSVFHPSIVFLIEYGQRDALSNYKLIIDFLSLSHISEDSVSFSKPIITLQLLGRVCCFCYLLFCYLSFTLIRLYYHLKHFEWLHISTFQTLKQWGPLLYQKDGIIYNLPSSLLYSMLLMSSEHGNVADICYMISKRF